MTKNAIDKIIQEDMAAFYNAKFEGQLPEKFMEYFKKAIFAIPPFNADFNFSAESIIAWKNIPVSDLSVNHVSKMIELISRVSRDKVFESLDEYLAVSPLMEHFSAKFTKDVNDFNDKTNRKKLSLEHTTGTVKEKKAKREPKKKAELAAV